jgi:hypothetical protein
MRRWSRGQTSEHYPLELRKPAITMTAEVRADYPSRWAAIEAVASNLRIGIAGTLGKRVRRRRSMLGSGRP